MPARKLARTVRGALRDAASARQAWTDPKFRAGLQKDRRATLRKFDTVEHALEDRAKAERAGASGRPGAAKASTTTKAKAKKR